MKNNSITILSTKRIMLAILVLNIFLIFIYYKNFPLESPWALLWGYFETDIFKLVTGSLLIPLLFSLLEKRYNFFENIRKQREERTRQQEEKRMTSRQEVINETRDLWQELYAMTTEIIFYNPEKIKDEEFNRLIIQLNNFSSSAEHIVNRWSHQFPNLSYDDHDIFLSYINLLFQSGLSVAYLSLQENDPQQIKIMQGQLFQIQDQIKSIANQSITNIFKYSAKYLELTETKCPKEEIDAEKKRIDDLLGLLSEWKNEIMRMNANYDNLLTTAKGIDIDQTRESARKIEAWLKEDRLRTVNQSDEFPNFQILFNQIPIDQRIIFLRIPFSREYLDALVNWFSLEYACLYIYNRAHGSF